MTQNTSLQYAVSDKIVHPHYGAGTITGVEQLDLIAGYERYYVIDMFEKQLTVRVPVRKVDELGIRKVMSSEILDRVLNTLRDIPDPLPEEYKTRQSEVRKRLQAGQPLETAAVVRDLFWHGQLDHLTKTDVVLLDQGRNLLAVEMALASDSDIAVVHQRIDAALASQSHRLQ